MVIKNIVGGVNPYENKKVKGTEQQRVAKPDAATNAQQSTTAKAADTVSFSDEARLRGTALKSANETPDVRRKKVDALKKQVQDGTYKMDLKKAAANLIRDDLDLLK